MEDKHATTGHHVVILIHQVASTVDHATEFVVKFTVSTTDHQVESFFVPGKFANYLLWVIIRDLSDPLFCKLLLFTFLISWSGG
jgi:hypothetical protein